MSRARNLADLLNASGKIKSSKMDSASNANRSIDSQHIADGSVDLAHLSSQSVDEDNLYVSNAGTDGQYLQKQSGNAGGLTWGTVDTSTLLPLAGGTMTGNTHHGDSVYSHWGNSNDLQIHHSGNHSYIGDYGTGNLYIRGNNLAVTSATGENYIYCVANGSVYLHYNNGLKLKTLSDGVEVSGNITISGTVDGRDVAADGTKLDGIEASATADQTDAEIKTAVEAATNIALGGSPTTTTQSAADNSTKVATTAYADAAIAALADSAPSTLNTLNELAAALGDDANYAATTTTAIGLKAPIASPTFTGNIGMPNGSIDRAMIGADQVDGSKIEDDSINSEHIADGAIDLAHMSSQSVDEDNLYVSNAGANGQYLQKQSGNAGGLTWGTVDTSLLLPKSGGAMTGAITTNSTFDGRDVAADGVLATNAMPKSGGTFTGNYTVDNYGIGAVGLYASTKYQSVWAMGSGYKPSADGTSLTGAYGLAWTHTNVGGQSKAGLGHQLLIVSGGSTTAALGTGVWTSGNVTAYSDKRVKENIEVIPNALEKVLQLSGYTFDRTDADMPRQTGLIAQEVLKVLPEAVSGSEEEHYSVAYGNLVGLLIEAIKEQQTQIETLMDMVGE